MFAYRAYERMVSLSTPIFPTPFIMPQCDEFIEHCRPLILRRVRPTLHTFPCSYVMTRVLSWNRRSRSKPYTLLCFTESCSFGSQFRYVSSRSPTATDSSPMMESCPYVIISCESIVASSFVDRAVHPKGLSRLRFIPYVLSSHNGGLLHENRHSVR